MTLKEASIKNHLEKGTYRFVSTLKFISTMDPKSRPTSPSGDVVDNTHQINFEIPGNSWSMSDHLILEISAMVAQYFEFTWQVSRKCAKHSRIKWMS